MRFAHLHTHSHFSLLDGLTKIDEMVERAKELGMDSIALTDHGSMYGIIEFYQKAKKAGIKPIVGCEMYITENMYDKRSDSSGRAYYHLIVLAANNTGYKNLIKLVTKSNLEGYYYKPRIDKNLLRQHSEGLIGLSACLGGELSKAVLSEQYEKAQSLALEYQDIFGKGNYFIELQHHPHIEDQGIVTPRLIKLAKELDIPMVATADSHYCRPQDNYAHDVLLAVQTGNTLGDKDRLSLINDDFSIAATDVMAERFKDVPEAIENTALIADRCNVDIEFGKHKLPKYPIPDGMTDSDYLRTLCERGLIERYGADNITEDMRKRIEYELGVITSMGFSSYFLIVQDYVNWAKNNGVITGPGRGSAAGSIVAYVLRITNIDPLKYNLLFERFLNPERVSMPDIDVDFDDARRSDVFEYVRQKYGADHFAQIITFGTMAARGSVRDAGRALGYPYELCDKISKLVPFNPNAGKKKGALLAAVEEVSELKQLYGSNQDVKRIIDSASRLEGVARHCSTHACAVVIAPEPLTEYLPLQRGTHEGDIITQFEMHAVEDIGLVKMDFLGLSNLTIIEKTLKLIEKNFGQRIDLDNIPLDDHKTFKLFQAADTTGVFQLECLTGDTVVSNTTIEKLYQNKHKKSLRSVYLDNGTIHNNDILDVVQSGKKRIFMVITENGRTIKASSDHQFMTKNGWKRLSELDPKIDQLLFKEKAKYIAYLQCKECRKELFPLSENFPKHQGFCYQCSARHFKNPSKPIARQAISKARLEFYQTGGKPWNYALNKDIDTTLALTGKKISDALTGVNFEMRYGKEEADKRKKKLSLRSSGSNNPMFGKKSPHRKGGYRADLGHYVRSNWEADFARILNLHKIHYAYEPQTFTLKRKNGELLSYTPDFYTRHDNTFYEIKGWMHELDQEKIDLFQKQYSEYNFVLISTTKFAELALQYKKLVAWECPVVPNQLTYTGIREIRELGEEMTYDIAMKPPGNNFIANSFIVHNSSGMKRYLKTLKPTNFEDIIVMISLYRPGPLDAGMVEEYIERKHGRRAVTYLHPMLEPILKNTFGIIVYQEQLMQIANNLGGFSLGQGYMLIKAVGKKIKQLLDEQREKLLEGMVTKNNIDRQTAAKIWDFIEPFARYGFNKSHAACYAMIGYQTAYLKAHYPIEFMAALMNSSSDDIERIAFLIEESREMGIEVLAPDINESMEDFSVVTAGENKGKIRFGLAAIKNVGENIVHEIIKERTANGHFESIDEVMRRVQSKDLNKKSLESLIRCGATDKLGERAKLVGNMDNLLGYSKEQQRLVSTKQTSLFDVLGTTVAAPTLRLLDVDPARRAEKLMWEKELLGLFISDHPLKDYENRLNDADLMTIKEAVAIKRRSNVKIAGVVIKVQKIITKTGKPMLFSVIEDMTSKIELVVFPSIYEQNAFAFTENNVLIVSGKLDTSQSETPKLLIDNVRILGSLV